MFDRISVQMREADKFLSEQSFARHFDQSAPQDSNTLTIFSIEALEELRAKQIGRSRQSAVLEMLSKESNRKPIRMVSNEIIQAVQTLKSKFVNFSDVIDAISKELLLANVAKQCPLRLSPILLVGPPGVGKTFFLNCLAKVFSVPYSQVDMGSVSAGFVLSGNSSSWAEGKTGHVTDTLRASDVANPIVLLDELDKATGARDYDVTGSLYSLLERDTAKHFMDECLGIPMNCSAIIWFASANYIEQVPEPIQSRMRVMHVAAPTSEMMPAICKSVFEDLLSNNDWGQFFEIALDDEICHGLSALPPRQIKRVLYDACCNAVVRTGGGEAIRLEKDDVICDNLAPRQRRIGFM